MSFTPSPASVIWDITYACPLRCGHCYSESGRRSARHLPLEEALRLVDVLVSMRPRRVSISGGEPLVLRGLPQIAERLLAAGIPVILYTSGFGVDEESADWITRCFSEVHVSVDGADAATHDLIRGMKGSFEQALKALALLDRLAAQRRERDGGQVPLGIDVSVVQSNFHQIERLCSEVAPRFPNLQLICLSSAVPSGLASREGYAELELLTDEQRAILRDSELLARLKALAPAALQILLFDGLGAPMQPTQIAAMRAFRNVMHIEPDGKVRGMSHYEGVVGNILEESPQAIWRRAKERQRDAFVVRELSAVRTMKDWAAATRNIDRHFSSSAELVRISIRKEHTAEAPLLDR